MTLPPGIRDLVLAAVAAVLTSAGAVAVLVHPEDGTRKITGTVDAAPGLTWSADAAAIDGRAGAVFRDPAAGSEFDRVETGFIEDGDTVVTVIGVADDSPADLRDPVMYGIDAATGAVRWHTAAAELGGCADVPVHGDVVCSTAIMAAQPALIGFDIATGAVTRTPVPWLGFAIAAVGDRVYVAEGDVESDDIRVHAGTLADPDAYWTRAFAMGTTWDGLSGEVLDVSHGQGVLTIGADLAGFDLGTGAPTWTTALDRCTWASTTSGALLVRVHTDCGDDRRTTADILDRTGRTLVTTDGDLRDPRLDRPADDTVPVLMGDRAYDRRDGTLRWTSPDLPATATGSEIATTDIVGDTVLLSDIAAETMTAVDLRTGQRLWRIQNARFGGVEGQDEHVTVLSDATGLWAVDRRTGETRWDIPFRAVNADPAALTGGGELTVQRDGRYIYAASHTVIGLRPLR